METKKGFLQNDRLLVCSMFVFYGVCILGLIGTTFWWLNWRNQTNSANATSTAAAHSTEQSQFEVVERFDDASGHWRVGEFKNNGSWEGSMEIKDGVYVLKVDKVQKPFFQPTDFFNEIPIKDFDVYLDTKFINGASANVCGGLDFRRSFKGWWHGVYVFFICKDSTFIIAYRGENGWEMISDRQFSGAILPVDWNRLEINARGDHFNFTINNVAVYEMTDDRQKEGALGIAIQVSDKNPAVIWFDNFGYQSR